MNQASLFQKFVAFTASVYEITNDMSVDVRSAALTPVQYKILEYIAVSEPVTLSQISECMHMSMPNTSRELRKLTEQRLCEKITDDEDRRKQFIRLSQDGQAMMNEAFAKIENRLEDRIGHLSGEERKEIERALDLLHSKVFY
ncbi:MarR family winged helix-turn-helix transcriptional regulator [Paenibacillus donghaensis]|uniref:MarR family transcriptional regulator n=1 Tax=Paenibacillus donghaensis TaxID=414771 RepID=A0A2Z2KF33_9BACL|nr:MarR family transcriptional regulator [Paenibacillus donghaensis]ASA24724.1 MarR family transcriptional regulator [Paenibacillus donghaensis]